MMKIELSAASMLALGAGILLLYSSSLVLTFIILLLLFISSTKMFNPCALPLILVGSVFVCEEYKNNVV